MCVYKGVFMASVRLQTTLPEEDMSFISSYKKLHKNYKSDSSVISYAINLGSTAINVDLIKCV